MKTFPSLILRRLRSFAVPSEREGREGTANDLGRLRIRLDFARTSKIWEQAGIQAFLHPVKESTLDVA